MSSKIKSILHYIGVVFFLILAIGTRPFGVANFIFIALSLIMIPGICNAIFSRFTKIGTWIKWITIIVLFMFGASLMPPQESSENINSTEETVTPVPSYNETDSAEASTGTPTEVPTQAPTEVPSEAPTEALTEPTTEAPTEPPHVHSWVNATCTTPKTCSSCGQTEGSADGHAWRDATCDDAKRCMECNATDGSAKGHTWIAANCTAAATCSSCGMTDGTALGHSYSSGKCTRCYESDPNYEPPTANNTGNGSTIYATPSGKRYHYDPDCGGKNSKIITWDAANRRGLTPCQKCAI